MNALKVFLAREVRLPAWVVVLVLSGLLLVIAAKSFPPRVSAENERQAEGYSVGFVLGHQLQRIKDQIDSDVAARGFRDGILSNEKQEPALLSPEVRNAALSRIQNRQASAEQKLAAAELERSLELMATIKKKPNVRELAPGIVIEPVGETKGPMASPKEHAAVTVIYQAKRSDGTLFDQSPPTGSEVKAGILVPGLRRALSQMPEGAHWLIYLAPDQAFGGSSRPGLPSQSVVVYDMKLLKAK